MGGLLVVLILILAVVFQVRGHMRSREHLNRWADENGIRLDDARYRWAPSPAFFFRRSRVQRLYNIGGVDAQGRRREGVARVGGWFLGALSDEVQVKWRDD